MKRGLSLLLCVLMISLTSCTLSNDGSSSMPTITNPESDITSFDAETSSQGESTEDGSESSSEKQTSSKTESEKSSSVQSEEGNSSSLDKQSYEQSSNNNSSSKDSTSSEKMSSEAVSSKPESSNMTSSDEVSSNQPSSSQTNTPTEPPKKDIKPVEPNKYYCYSKLNPVQKKAYDILLAETESMPNKFIELGDADEIKGSDVYLVAIALKNDHPEIFWLPYAWYIGETHNGQLAILFVNKMQENVGGSIESITATYVVERAKKQKMQQELKAAVEKIKSKITATDPYEIELQIHDILCKQITYTDDPSPSLLAYTAYGALVQGNALCEGYSRAFQLLLYEFGINSTLVTGYAGQEHMWNLVEIDGKWYHVDVTWNDQNDTQHSYFNLTDGQISQEHIMNPSVEELTTDEIIRGVPFNLALPICNSTDAYFYNKTGLVLPRDIEKLVSGIESGSMKQIEVIGWNKQIEKTLKERITQKELKFIYDIDNGWALITVKD